MLLSFIPKAETQIQQSEKPRFRLILDEKELLFFAFF